MEAKASGGGWWWPYGLLVGAFACIFGVVAPAFITRYRIALPSAAGIYCSFVLMLLFMAAPGIASSRLWVQEQLKGWGRVAIPAALWCIPYLIYAAGTGDFHWLALLRIAFVSAALPLIYSFFPVADVARFGWQDLASACLLASVLLFHQLGGIWNVPANLDFMGRLLLVGVASWSWTFVRRVPELGYEFAITPKILRAAALNFVPFALIAIPAGVALHFIAWNPRRVTIFSFCLDYLEIFLFIAILEEMFFLGFLQTLLAINLKSARASQILVSCLFGLFHILHAPFPNWRYVLLATVAGWFYGSAFLQGGNLMASALTHAMVDTVWRMFFTR